MIAFKMEIFSNGLANLNIHVNGLHYAVIETAKPKYLIINPQNEHVSLRGDDDSPWQIDRDTLCQAAFGRQQIKILVGDIPVTIFLSAIKNKSTTSVHFRVEQDSYQSITESSQNEKTFQVRQDAPKSFIEYGSTIQTDALDSKILCDPVTSKLDYLAIERQKIISQLFNKLTLDVQVTNL